MPVRSVELEYPAFFTNGDYTIAGHAPYGKQITPYPGCNRSPRRAIVMLHRSVFSDCINIITGTPPYTKKKTSRIARDAIPALTIELHDCTGTF